MSAKQSFSIYSDKELNIWIENDRILYVSFLAANMPKDVWINKNREEINNYINKIKRYEARN